jgi:hypothetical protein
LEVLLAKLLAQIPMYFGEAGLAVLVIQNKWNERLNFGLPFTCRPHGVRDFSSLIMFARCLLRPLLRAPSRGYAIAAGSSGPLIAAKPNSLFTFTEEELLLKESGESRPQYPSPGVPSGVATILRPTWPASLLARPCLSSLLAPQQGYLSTRTRRRGNG